MDLIKKQKNYSIISIIFVSLFSLISFTERSSFGLEEKNVSIRAFGDPQTFDWNKAHTWMDGLIFYNIMEGLVTSDDQLHPKPALAERWEISKDLKEYTFFIKKNVYWSDGVKLTAQHFADGLKRVLTPDLKSKYASMLFDLENAEEYQKGILKDFSQVGVKVLNESTLVLKLKSPVSFWFWFGSIYTFFPVRADLLKNNEFTSSPENIVTLGPYKIGKYVPNEKIELIKNHKYYAQETVVVEKISLPLLYDDNSALKLFAKGELDLLPKVAAIEKFTLQKENKSNFISWNELKTVHLRFNTSNPQTKSIALRKAISLSINREGLKEVFNDDFKPASNFLPPGVLGYSSKKIVEFNPQKALQILKKEGIEPQKLPPLNLFVAAFNDTTLAAQFVKDELKKNLGLQVKIYIMEPKRYYSPQLNYSDFSLQIALWNADFPDPDNFFSPFSEKSGFNRDHWKNDFFEELLLKGRKTLGSSNRTVLYQKLEKILLDEEVVSIPLYYGKMNSFKSKNIQSMPQNASNWMFFKRLKI